MSHELTTGAELRLTGPSGAPTVLCANGGRAAAVAGTWSASLEWIVGELAPRFPELGFAELKYRIKSWNRLDSCIADARAALEEVAAPRTLLLGFSMGGAVSVSVADDPSVETVVGLAPWLPARLSLEPLRGRRLRVIHGSLDQALPGVPGVSPNLSRQSLERAEAMGVEAEYTLIPGAVHALALRAPWGRPVALPRAARWRSLVADELDRFQAA